jgi:group I intron endonuclease
MIVYRVRNLVNGKLYIGQTKKTLARRWTEHTGSTQGYCRVFYAAIKKYGKDAFEITKIAEVETREEANALEQSFIESEGSLSPRGYNLLPGGAARSHHPETRRKMSESHKGQKMTGRAAAGVPRGPRPGSVGKAISLAKKGRPNGLLGVKRPGMVKPTTRKGVEGFSVESGRRVFFSGASEAAKILKVQRANIVRALKGRSKSAGGYRWLYLTDDGL